MICLDVIFERHLKESLEECDDGWIWRKGNEMSGDDVGMKLKVMTVFFGSVFQVDSVKSFVIFTLFHA